MPYPDNFSSRAFDNAYGADKGDTFSDGNPYATDGVCEGDHKRDTGFILAAIADPENAFTHIAQTSVFQAGDAFEGPACDEYMVPIEVYDTAMGFEDGTCDIDFFLEETEIVRYIRELDERLANKIMEAAEDA